MSFERLDDTGLRFVETSIEFAILAADFGDGYEATALVGSTEGLRAWRIEVRALPDMEEYQINAGEYGLQTRARYLWDFYCRRMARGNESFWIRDHTEGRDYLVKFTETKLTFQIFTARLFSVGLELRQRRERGIEGVSAVTDEINPDSI